MNLQFNHKGDRMTNHTNQDDTGVGRRAEPPVPRRYYLAVLVAIVLTDAGIIELVRVLT